MVWFVFMRSKRSGRSSVGYEFRLFLQLFALFAQIEYYKAIIIL